MKRIFLAGFKSKTRYNVRLSGRKGVEVVEINDRKDIEVFLDLLEETAERDGIRNHPQEHYRKLIALRSQTDVDKNTDVKLYLAKHEGDVLAGAIITFAGEVATYLHGASSNKKRNLMAPFGLHWEIMKQAKELGYKKYDLGGTKLVKSQKSKVESQEWMPEDGSWQGITRFKLGFCPNCQPIEFPGGYDIVISKWKYRLYRLVQWAKG